MSRYSAGKLMDHLHPSPLFLLILALSVAAALPVYSVKDEELGKLADEPFAVFTNDR